MISFIDHDRINYLIITYFRETSFSRFKKFREIEVPRKKGAAKIKDTKFSDLYKNLYLSFPSARSLHTSRRATISV